VVLTITVRGAVIGGAALAVCIGLYLLWLWGPAHQVRLHTEKFFHAIERKDWAGAANFIDTDYQDQWGDDRTRVLERMREGFRYVPGPRIVASNPAVQVQTHRAAWTSKIIVYSTDDDVMEVLDERVNSLATPFELEWYRLSGKPWDWKLVRASNSAFEIPPDLY
jgi:hypothetical protein